MPSDSPPLASGAAPASPAPRAKRTLLWVFTTSFGEGLPWSFLHQMCTEFLTATGASKTQISSTSLLHLAVTFKFAWSPIVDLFGKKRTWLWALQLLLGAGMMVVAAVAPLGNLRIFWAVIGVLAIVHATHDIACDGFYLQALEDKQRALFSGVRAFFNAASSGSNSLPCRSSPLATPEFSSTLRLSPTMMLFCVTVMAMVSFGVARADDDGGRTSSDAVTVIDDAENDLMRNTRMMVIRSIIAVMLSSLISPSASRSRRFLRAIALRKRMR
jgi:hypothetical protein